MRLSIVIVNYKTPALVLNCIQSIKDYDCYAEYDIIVVDNCSMDNSEKVIKERFPEVRFIQMGNNSGFARANNEGIRQAKGEVLLLLNSDTLVEDNAIEKCFAQFAQADYVACGVQLLNPDKTPQISGNYFMTGSLNNLLPLPYIGNLIKWLGNVVKVKKPNVPDAQTEVEVDWINGAFLMVKEEVIDKAGLMDEEFFLYAEETEWCSRLRKFGKLCIYGQYKVIHLQGETANKTFGSSGKGYYNLYDRKGLQIMLSNLLRIRKQLGAGWFLFHITMYSIAVPVCFIGDLIGSLIRLRNPLPGFYRALRLAGNVTRLWGFSYRIIARKPYFYKVL